MVLKMTRGAGRSDSDETEKLITKVCTNFITQMEAKIDAKLSKLDSKLSSLITWLKHLEDMATMNKDTIQNVQVRLDSLEQNYKQNCVRICGLNVVKDDNVATSVAAFITKELKIQCSSNDFDYAYQLKSENKEKSQSIVLVRFLSNIFKSKVVSVKKMLKNTGVVIHEDLTRSRYRLLVAAKRKYGKNAWSAGGKVYYWDSVKNSKILVLQESDI